MAVWTVYLSLCLLFALSGSEEIHTQIGKRALCRHKVCSAGWTPYRCRCFKFFNNPKTWIEAEKSCLFYGVNLASVHSLDEYTFLQNLIDDVTHATTRTWLGGSDAISEGTWLNSDGSKMDFNLWAPENPSNYEGNENCLEMNYGGTSNMNDVICTWKNPFKSCLFYGGNLASVHSLDEYTFLQNMIRSATHTKTKTWLGGSDAISEGTWLNSDGSKMDFNLWAPGEPNNYEGNENCLEMNYGGTSNMNDVICTWKNPFVCA